MFPFLSDKFKELRINIHSENEKHLNVNVDLNVNKPLCENTSVSEFNVLKFRKQINVICNDCISLNLNERDRISNLFNTRKHNSYKLKRLKSLEAQQEEFDNYVATVHEKIFLNEEAIEYKFINSAIKSLELECEIFKLFSPAYGLKKQYMKQMKENQITIIRADFTYSFNVILPLILCNKISNSIVCCEQEDLLSDILKNKIHSVIQFHTNEMLKDKVHIFSAKQLLNKFSSGTYFESVSFVILNISLKRSIVFDILLANLRDLIETQKKLKIVLILSPYDNYLLFEQYFASKTTVSVFNTTNLIFPVKIMWKEIQSSANSDFIKDAVNSVLAIHTLYEPGDIIVFLSSNDDIDYMYQELDAKISKYQYGDMKVFCPVVNNYDFLQAIVERSDLRRVFLLNNGYENIIISSAIYVIDCGIQTIKLFDSKTDLTTVKSTFISQSLSNLRKSIAGINKFGTCFKLYSKTNYFKDMPCKEMPEILCVNPFYSMIQVFNHRPHSENIHFIESIPEDIQSNTLILLKDYGVVNENLQLTPFGEDLIKLPIPPKYSRLILFGLQSGFLYEAIVLTAFFSVQDRIFIDVNDYFIKNSQLEFNCEDSDTLSFLKIFKNWKNNGYKKAWCDENYINYTTLKSIRLHVSEISYIVYKCLGESVIEQFAEKNTYSDLINMLFLCFQKKLCVFTGHKRSGYQILDTKDFATVHPTSFVSSSNPPQFVIYDKLISSSNRKFILNLTSVPHDIIFELLKNDLISFTHSDLFECSLEKRVIGPVGQKFISQILLKNDEKKIKEIEQNILKDTGAEVVFIDPVLGTGNIIIYAFPSDIDACYIAMKNIVHNYIDSMTHDEEIKTVELVKGQRSVTIEIKWRRGAQTVFADHVLLPFAFSNTKTLSDFEHISEPSHSFIHYSLKLFWPRRKCVGDGYVNFLNKVDFSKGRKLGGQFISVGKAEVFVEVSKLRENQLHLTEISPEITKKDIEKCFSKLLPKCEVKIELCYTPPFETTNEKLLEIKKEIENNCTFYTNLQRFDVQVLTPEPSAKYMRAYVHVFEQRSLKKEAENISTTEVNGIAVMCEPWYFSNIECSSEIYNALKCCILEEMKLFKIKLNDDNKNNTNFQLNVGADVITSDDISLIKLSSNDLEIIKALQLKINNLLDGVKLNKSNVNDIHKLFCHGGYIFLKTLEKTENIFIKKNFETKTLRLYGLPINCNRARQSIYNFLEDSENEIFKTIILSSDKNDRKILKAVIIEYGANLEKFIELCGLRSASLDIKTCRLLLHGNSESIEKAEDFLKQLSTDITCHDTVNDIFSEELCAACLCPAQSLSYRLEACGHLYCPECIRGLIDQSLNNEAKFPIQCCAQNCSEDIILGDIRYVLNDDAEIMNRLVNNSLKDYLKKNGEGIFYCPAADCSMFAYKNKLTGNTWSCPLCQNVICLNCNVIYHEGYSCDMYRGTREDPDYSFKVWQKTTNQCKICPTCKTAIEKKSGCNHMTCKNCGTHFCWLCLAVPPNNDVYSHISRVHVGQLFTW